jgi:hypothetical protein
MRPRDKNSLPLTPKTVHLLHLPRTIGKRKGDDNKFFPVFCEQFINASQPHGIVVSVDHLSIGCVFSDSRNRFTIPANAQAKLGSGCDFQLKFRAFHLAEPIRLTFKSSAKLPHRSRTGQFRFILQMNVPWQSPQPVPAESRPEQQADPFNNQASDKQEFAQLVHGSRNKITTARLLCVS